MARNSQVARFLGGRRTVTREFTDIDFSDATAGQEDFDITELKHIDDRADVHAEAYGSGDTDDNEGYVARVTAVSGNTVTVKLYQGGGAGAPLDDASVADIDHVVVQATGL